MILAHKDNSQVISLFVLFFNNYLVLYCVDVYLLI